MTSWQETEIVKSGKHVTDTSVEALAGTLAHDCDNVLTTILRPVRRVTGRVGRPARCTIVT